ncbi:MAG: bifunctional 4-hydroxy-2-oxoglutarate aldolase/2-dehydro-3-deoxy-phosphogluconate aldolase [Acidobacteria bacterium]|nr:MAG: bifunctional 4-hydroxy-2-oxoglutarate aldolase/2-dehydro-3-deoxy-phosphogluconate aldolase [Acidobacteriota bacterium]
MLKILRRARVLPVVTVDRAGDAVPLARALVAGGLRVIEITLRSDAALEAIRRIAGEVPAATVGAGTVTRPAQLAAARDAGARFAVSPGLTDDLAAAAGDVALPFLPGVSTPSEALAAAGRGFRVLKLFPAELLGGPAYLRALAGPLPELRFCPTGGIGPDTAAAYLEQPNVVCVGGSWLAPRAAIRAGDWRHLRRLAAAASHLHRPPAGRPAAPQPIGRT